FTVIAALLSLLFATFQIYSNLGIPLAIGIGVMLLAGLTLLPALLAIFGKAAFWPSKHRPGSETTGLWGRIASRIVRRPGVALAIGVIVFGALSVAVTAYQSAGFGGQVNAPAGTDSAAGTNLLNKYFPVSAANPTNLVYKLSSPAWDPATASQIEAATTQLSKETVFSGVTGPLNPVGKTIQFETSLSAGDPSTTAAMNATPAARDAATAAAGTLHAVDSGVTGEAPALYDISSISNSDLAHVIPIAIIVIGVLLALVAPLYLIASVAISYFAALGLAVIVFIWLGGSSGITFILPFLLFIFLLALGEDYNILVMTRIRE